MSRYGHIPGEFFGLGYMSILPRVVTAFYACLCYHHNQKTRQCNPSQELLRREGGVSNRTVMKATKMLVRVGLIEASQQGRYEDSQKFKSIKYTIKPIKKSCPPKGMIKEWWKEISGEVDMPLCRSGITGNGSKSGSNRRSRDAVGEVSRDAVGAPGTKNLNKELEQRTSTSFSNETSPLEEKKAQRAEKKKPSTENRRESKDSLLGRSKAGESKLGTKPHKGMPSLAVESLRELLKSREPRWLRAHLVSRGYDPREADKAIREAQAPEAKRPKLG